MSRHEGVSCDSCMKANFRGRRYKCLICYDYDLCSGCYEAGATTTRHTVDHPMQCIITRSDFDLYYGGEAVSADHPQSFVCPYCGKMGFTDTTLQEHVTADHPDSSTEVVCPICAALPGGDPNHVTDDFAAHLSLEHRAPRDFEEPMGIRHVRRIPHTRGGGARTRRSNMQFHSNTSGGSTLAGLTPSSRESMDPIAELLSQLSSVRSRAAAAQSVSSQLQQLEMQLQSTRQQLERLPRRPTDSNKSSNQTTTTQQPTLLDYAGAVISTGGGSTSVKKEVNSHFLLAKIGDQDLTELEKQGREVERADRSIFVQELMLSSLAESLRLSDEDDAQCSDGSTREDAEVEDDSRGGDDSLESVRGGEGDTPTNTPSEGGAGGGPREEQEGECDTRSSWVGGRNSAYGSGSPHSQTPSSSPSGGGSGGATSTLASSYRSASPGTPEASSSNRHSAAFLATSAKERALHKVKAMGGGGGGGGGASASSLAATEKDVVVASSSVVAFSATSNVSVVKH